MGVVNGMEVGQRRAAGPWLAVRRSEEYNRRLFGSFCCALCRATLRAFLESTLQEQRAYRVNVPVEALATAEFK